MNVIRDLSVKHSLVSFFSHQIHKHCSCHIRLLKMALMVFILPILALHLFHLAGATTCQGDNCISYSFPIAGIMITGGHGTAATSIETLPSDANCTIDGHQHGSKHSDRHLWYEIWIREFRGAGNEVQPKQDKPVRLIIRLLYGFVSDFSILTPRIRDSSSSCCVTKKPDNTLSNG